MHSKRAEIPCFHRILGSSFLTNTGGSEKIQFKLNQLYIARELREFKNTHAEEDKEEKWGRETFCIIQR